MKKAKIILVAIGVLATVGGGLAFKAHNAYFGGSLRCSLTTAPTSVCVLFNYATTITPLGTMARCTGVAEPLSAPCVPVRVTFLP